MVRALATMCLPLSAIASTAYVAQFQRAAKAYKTFSLASLPSLHLLLIVGHRVRYQEFMELPAISLPARPLPWRCRP